MHEALMVLLDWFKALWPVAAVLAAFGIRLEVARALTKQSLREVEKDIVNAEKTHDRAIQSVHARLSRHENQTNKYLSEIRSDIKTLLSRNS